MFSFCSSAPSRWCSMARVLRRLFSVAQFRTGLAPAAVRCNATTTATATKSGEGQKMPATAPLEYRYIFPEFLPDPNMKHRNKLREKLERADMIQRRKVLQIPEFYVGSVLGVTVTDVNAADKKNRFVGICIYRGDSGLRHNFILRNVVDRQGVEILYDLYCPLIREIQVLRLEKRIDDSLFYLRDALPEYSTFPFDMEPEVRAEGAPVSINAMKVKLRPRPWLERYERQNLKGVEDLNLPQRFYDKAAKVAKPWEKYDLMLQYRKTIPAEEQEQIYSELHQNLDPLLKSRRNKH